MKKSFGQTVRDLKREVNKKVLKVPSIEQKVLDATSNEPWGPHGTLIADIAQASKNYHEYQMILAVIWKRINDTGKNWRHVYKALTVLEYLVANGSERVIDEIREHAYQIQTLSDFQYIDSSGRDQGNNVRKKSQSLVVLVNDKERIFEVRQKAAANREKYRNTSTGGMYRPGSHSNLGGYDDDRYEGRYGSRDEDRNGYGREREQGKRDDERYGRYGDSYGRDGDRYGRDSEDRYGRDGYRDEDYHGRSQSVEDNQYGSRSRSSDRDRFYEDDDQYSSRGSGGRADDQSQDGRFLERKFSEQNLGAPPSYEEAVGAAQSPTHGEQGELPSTYAPKSSSPLASASPGLAANTSATKPAPASGASPPAFGTSPPAPSPPVEERKEVDNFDEFDPRGSFSAVPTTSDVSGSKNPGSAEIDLLGSLSDSLALVPATSVAPEIDASVSSNAGPFLATSASSVTHQMFDDPFGEGPFKAIPSAENFPAQPQNIPSTSSFDSSLHQNSESDQLAAPKADTVNSFGDAFPGAAYMPSSTSIVQPPANIQNSQPEPFIHNPEIDILADILSPTGPQALGNSQAAYLAPTGQPSPQVGFPPQNPQTLPVTGFLSQPGPAAAPPTSLSTHSGQPVGLTGFPAQSGQPSVQTNFQAQSSQLVPQHFYAQSGQPVSLTGFPAKAGLASQTGFPSQTSQPTPVGGFPSQMVSSPQAGFHSQSPQHNANLYGSYNPHMGSVGPVTPQMTSQVSSGPALQNNSVNFLSQSSSATPASSHINPPSSPVGSNAPVVSQPIVPASMIALTATQPAKDKFETKSTVWADTLSRGLVNLNISGSKINPLSDIGIDFDAINRKEKRMEKSTTAPVTSTITMGKAMGSGSGIGRAGAGALMPASNQMMGSGMGMGMGAGAVPGMGMGGYGTNQSMGMNSNMGIGMSMGMGQGGQTQRPMGFPPGASMPSGYNPMMGAGNYSQQPYGGGYR